MTKKQEIQKKLQFQKVVVSLLFIVFLIFLILSFVVQEAWTVIGAMISIFLLIDYLFIVIFFNGNASKKKKIK